MTIELSPEVERSLLQSVEKGGYQDVNELLEEALHFMMTDEYANYLSRMKNARDVLQRRQQEIKDGKGFRIKGKDGFKQFVDYIKNNPTENRHK